jgi:hypothetical protein
MSDTRTKPEQMADWLVRIGYPFDFMTEEQPPRWLVRELAHAWLKHEGDDTLTADDYLDMFRDDGCVGEHEEGAG